jgi:O-methyltransferase
VSYCSTYWARSCASNSRQRYPMSLWWAWFRAIDAALAPLRRTWFSRLVNRILVHVPGGIGDWLRKEKGRAKQRMLVLVPEQELEAKYRDALHFLLDHGGSDDLGDYLEFGVFHGASLTCMHRALKGLNLDRVRLFGFDSFEGLPVGIGTEYDFLPWKPGQYRADYDFTVEKLRRAGVDWARTFLIKGWFSEVLNDALVAHYGISKASIIMIDCDLYSSSKQALDFCAPLIRDRALIFFDDWSDGAKTNHGEKRAFDEFLQANPQLQADEFGTYWHLEESVPSPSKIFHVWRK